MPDIRPPADRRAGRARARAICRCRSRDRAQPSGDGFFARLARALFGWTWKSGPTRADLEVVLEAAVPGETGFSPEERTMLQNILALRERRIEDVMVPRADIVAVQQDISLGELVKVFESAAHSRLVVYNDTLDDPVGMVHIRDLIAFMTARAAVDPDEATPGARSRCRPASTSRRSISRCRCRRPRSCARSCSCRRRCRRSTCSPRCRRRASISRWWSTNTAAPTASSRSRTSSSRSSATSTTSTTRTSTPSVVRQPDGSFVADARASLEDVTAAVGPEFDVGDAAEEVDTLGGYMMAQVGRLPVRGELVPGPDRLRDRSARRRSAPDQEGAHPPQQEPRRSSATATAGAATARRTPRAPPSRRPPRRRRRSPSRQVRARRRTAPKAPDQP